MMVSTPGSEPLANARRWLAHPIRVLPIALIVDVIWLRNLNIAEYNRLLVEDGAVECLQTILFLTAAVFFVRIALVEIGASRALAFGLMAGTFFLAGEEISWGQRIFGLETPPQLRAINTQGEITVHNIKVVLTAFRALTWVAAIYGLLIPYLIASRSSTVTRLLVPSRGLHFYFGAIIWYFIYTRIVHDGGAKCPRIWQLGQGACRIAWNEQEWMELLVAAVFVLHAADAYLGTVHRRRIAVNTQSLAELNSD